MLQACMRGNFFKKPKKFSGTTGGKSCRNTLNFPLLQLNLKINSTTLPTQSLCIHTSFSQLLI